MTTYNKILLGLIAAAYFISPIDIIPDFFIPYLGWFDDTAVIGIILYYIKYGRIPDLFYKKRGGFFRSKSSKNFHYSSSSGSKQKSNQNSNDRFAKKSTQKGATDKQPYSDKKSTEADSTSRETNEQNRENSHYQKRVGGEASLKKEEPFKDTTKSAYYILGVSTKASKEEIQAAYRKAVKQYHPDRVAHLGEDLQQLANKKFIEIKDAYNLLIKS